MPRNVTLTFEDGSTHVYQNAPDDITPDQVQARAAREFADKRLTNIDGGRQPESLGQRALGAAKSVMRSFGEAIAPANEAAMRTLGVATSRDAGAGRGGINTTLADQDQSAQQATDGSVLASAKAKPIGSTNPSLAPVDPKMREQFNAAWDLATPEERAQLSLRNGWVGQLARERDGLFNNPDAVMTETGDRFDPRLEKRAQRLVAAGEDPRFAKTAARTAIRAGVAPGKELSAVETLQPSSFDFDTAKAFDPNATANGVNRTVGRGLAKGALGLSKAVSGYGEFLADVYGLDEAGAVAKQGGEWARGKEQAIGERGDFLQRNMEGAISSIAQQLPLLALGAAKASEAIPLAGMAVQTFGQEYSDGRKSGQDVRQAAARASMHAAFEVIGERFGLSKQLEQLRQASRGVETGQLADFFGDWLKNTLQKEVPGELLTTTGQFGVDRFAGGGVGLRPDATWADYTNQVADTIAQTVMQGGVMAAGTTGAGAAASHLEQKGPSAAQVEAEAMAARDRAMKAWDSARAKGFHVEPPMPTDRPTVRRAKAVDMFTELGAMFGIPKKPMDLALQYAETVPADKLPGFFSRYAQALEKRGLVKQPIDRDVLAAMELGAPAVAQIQQGALADEAVQQAATQPAQYQEASQALDYMAMGARVDQQAVLDAETGNQAPEPDLGGDQQLDQIEPAPPAPPQTQPTVAVSTPLDAAAHEAATSPTNDRAEPTQAQKEAGNYKVGRTRVAGMDVRIENPQGSKRRGVAPDGTPWETEMRAHYGYFAGTEGADGDKLDVFIKPGTDEDWRGPVFVVDQIDPKTGQLDEHKVVMGAADEAEAEALYRSNYDADWQGLGAITRLPLPAFKAWAKSGRLKEPLGDIAGAPQLAPDRKQAPAAQALQPVDTPQAAPAELATLQQQDEPNQQEAQNTTPTPQTPQEGADPGSAGQAAAGEQGGGVSGAGPAPAAEAVGVNSEFPPESEEPAEVQGQEAQPIDQTPVATQDETDAATVAEVRSRPRVIGRAGRTPNSAQDIELRANADGTLTPWSDGYELLDFDSGEPIILSADASDAAAVDAIKSAGALGRGVKIYAAKTGEDTASFSIAADAPDGEDLSGLPIFSRGSADGVSGGIGGGLGVIGIGEKPSAVFRPNRTAISAVDLDEVIDVNLDRWRGIGLDRIVAVDHWTALPQQILDDAKKKGSHAAAVEGVVYRGKVYLVRSNLRDRAHAERVLFHEVLGHVGVRRLLSGKPTEELNRIWDKLNGLAGVAKLAKKHQVGDGYTAWDRLQPYVQTVTKDQVDRRAKIVEELIAFLAQANDTGALTQFKGYLADLKAAVVALARKLGLNGLADRLDRAGAELDVLQLVRDARRAIERGTTRDGQAFVLVSRQPAPAYSEASVEEAGFSLRADEPVRVPDVIVGNPLSATANHPDYVAAKAGDVDAAVRLALDLVTPDLVAKVRAAVGENVIVQPVTAEEAAGRNKIPLAGAKVLAQELGASVGLDVVQGSRAHRTAMDGLGRLFASPEFIGDVVPGGRYLLLDDTLTQGGTFAALASHIQQNGGTVVGAVALTGKQYSATLRLSPELLSQVRETYSDVEPAFRAATGRGFDSLTQSEARYLAKHKSPDDVRGRIAEAGRQAGGREDGHDPQRPQGLRDDSGADRPGTPPEDTRFSFAPEDGTWVLPEGSKTDDLIYELQDGRIDLKRTQEAIIRAGGQIEQAFDARLRETLFPGRVAARSTGFIDAEVRPLLEVMARNQVSMNELSDYLHARGAPERNAQIAKVNPDLQDGGAGTNTKGVLMTNAAAKAHIESIRPLRRDLLNSLAKRVDAITAGTRKLLVDEGLESPEVIAAWESVYPNYIPMFRDEAESGNPHPIGTGMSVRGSASKRATGSTKEVTNILAHVLMQREAAITRAEKNRVAVSLYGLALTNPNKKVWATIRPGMTSSQIDAELRGMGVDPDVAAAGMEKAPTVRTVDEISGKVVNRLNPLYKSLPGAIVVRVKGEDRVLMLNQGNPRALRMAENIKNMDGLTKLDLAGSIVGQATRWMASVNTAYNPVFGLVNVVRDTLGAAVNLSSTALRGKSTRVLWDTPAALQGIGREIAGLDSGQWGELYRQFQEDGGQTGYRDLFLDANARTKELEAALKSLESNGLLSPKTAGLKVLAALEGFNTVLENGVRLSAYKAALDHGMSRDHAAKLARELTVDFNRKGRMTRELGPLYAFFNASVQGSARTIEALRGPAGRKIMLGGLALGVLQAAMLALAGYEDDEIPEFIKARAFIIPLGVDEGGVKKWAAIPLPLGLHVLPNTGRVLIELAMSGGDRMGERVFDAVGEIAGAFNPLGGGNIFTLDGALKTVAPTVIDPVIELATNKNFAGTPIEKEPRGRSDMSPGFTRAREKTLESTSGQAYLGISKALNRVTGGDDYEAGAVSPTPERLRYLAQVVGGGLLREIEKVVDASGREKPVESHDMPLVGRFYGKVDDELVQRRRYFDNVARIEQAEKIRSAAEKAGDETKITAVKRERPEVEFYDRVKEVKRDLSDAAKERTSSVELDRAEHALMKAFNTDVKNGVTQARAAQEEMDEHDEGEGGDQ